MAWPLKPVKGPDGKARCGWCGGEKLYVDYHDKEWGVPVLDDRKIFEFLILEGAQAGLSWSTILNKRDHYRKAFDKFDARKIAKYQQGKVDALLGDAGIVRNRMKIAAAIGNAKAFLAVQKEFGTFDAYIWQFTGGRPIQNGWELEIHGWVFESEPHRALTAIFRRSIGLHEKDLTPDEKSTFTERAQWFLADNERRKRISIRLGDQTLRLTASAANGHFSERLRLSAEALRSAGISGPTNKAIAFETVSGDQRIRSFTGEVCLLEDTGISVISDIDDTIKVSQVLDRNALRRNTFCRPFQPVPGMAAAYQNWARSAGAQFHYVSASPWQLYEPLAEFLRTNGFPEGTFHLKFFRIKDHTFFDLFRSPERFKFEAIEPILKRFPNRRFVLVGDSGERDPEIYATLGRKYPQQILRIFIRDTTNEPFDSPRYRKAFQGLPRERLKIFKDASEIMRVLP